MACEPLDLEIECDKALNVCAPTDSRFKRVVIALLCQGGGGGGVQPNLITDCDGDDAIRTKECAPTSANASLTRTASTGAGSVTAGQMSVDIVNVGNSDGTIDVGNGAVALSPGESFAYRSVLDPVTNTYYRCPAISYDATGTTFHILVMA